MTYSVVTADCLEWLPTIGDDSVDLVFFSPPYEAARSYGIGFDRRGQDWVDWMVRIFGECQRICKGLVACVCEGTTSKFRWSATPALLMADLHRAGFKIRKPPAFQRVGIPGSGGPDWLRNDYEFIVCTSKGKLPWSDNTACGHKPKWAPGGEMSYRLSDGSRRNEFGMSTTCLTSGQGRKRDGKPKNLPPVKANPGNVIRCKVGGGLMGSPLAHKNEAPFPEKLSDFFVLSFCPPGGLVCDPFTGSGTTGASAVKHGRRFLGCDIRESQVEIAMRRLAGITPSMF